MLRNGRIATKNVAFINDLTTPSQECEAQYNHDQRVNDFIANFLP
jgi:hypothetical protein